jgi:dTDP-4-dehydrorhamnose reductase
MKILVFGAGGMIGSAMFRVLHDKNEWQVWGTLRSCEARRFFTSLQQERLLMVGDVEHSDQLVRAFAEVKPDVVINCIGLTKHHKEAEDPLLAIPLNALLPHRMADLCKAVGARLIHISTDCVFSGERGNYTESDVPDAIDIYGKSKHLGEVVNSPHAITLRTSTIGHELQSAYGLLEWFLAQQSACNGFSLAVFSGLPNTTLAQIVRDHVIPHAELHGLYHVGAEPIGKYDLLKLLAKQYGKPIDIARDDNFVIDRSLNSERFTQVTGYRAAPWPDLIRDMHATR